MSCNNYSLIQNSIIVGFITSIIGTLTNFLVTKDKNKNICKNICKNIFIFFIVGFIVHIIIEAFNFNQFFYNKKCYSKLFNNNLCKVRY